MNKKEHLAVLESNPDDPRHELPAGYIYGCRCEKCRATHTKQVREQRMKHRAALQANPDDPRHGTRVGKRYGCRCDKCRGWVESDQIS